MEKEELRKVSVKNYIILAIVLLLSLGIVYYFHLWYVAYSESKLSNKIMDKYMDNINYNELDNYLTENGNAIIYVSVLNNKEIRDFELDFKSLFKRKKINYNVLYMDITNDIDEFSKVYSNVSIPSIMIFNSGKYSISYNIDTDDYNLNEIREYINNFVSESELND